jgi:PIN domain nuclease of toxin-antitoxin system
LLAVILNEPGAEMVQALLDDSEVLAVNIAEVARKLFSKGMPHGDVIEILDGLHLDADAEEFGLRQAAVIGAVAAANRKIGLSLGDASCLTMGAWHGLKVVTADRVWSKCEWPDLEGFDKAPEIVTVR